MTTTTTTPPPPPWLDHDVIPAEPVERVYGLAERISGWVEPLLEWLPLALDAQRELCGGRVLS